MHDALTFESRLADAYARYVEPAPVAVNAAAIAASVSVAPRRSSWASVRLLLVAALVAAALVTAALVGSGWHLPNLLTLGPTPAHSAWAGVYLRVDPTDTSLIDVVVARPDGHERLLRRLDATISASEFPLTTYGAVSEHGWLAVSTTSSGQLPIATYAIYDLADPARDPQFVPYPPVIGGRWSSNDLFAASSAKGLSPTSWMSIDVFNPRTGTTIGLGKIQLFGGGPSIVWAADGSGILDGRLLQPVGGGPNVALDPALRFTDRRLGIGARVIEDFADWYTSIDPNLQPFNSAFANDGRSLLVTLEQISGERHRAIVGRVDAPNHLIELVSVDLVSGGHGPYLASVDPDDTAFAIQYSTGDTNADFQAPILFVDGTSTAAPIGAFAGYVHASLAEAWPALGPWSLPAATK
jgi:hypothetical protein